MEEYAIAPNRVHNMLATLGQHKIYVLFGLSVAIFGVVSLVPNLLKMSQTNNSPTTLLSEVAETASAASLGGLSIDIAGAVRNPGVYQLRTDTRVQDAIVAAGGFSDSADKDFVARHMNLAAKLSDGQKIYVLHDGEDKAVVPQAFLALAAPTSSQGVAQGGKISLNNASPRELESLPGIGTVTATKIIQNRPFDSVEDVLNKKAVTNSTFVKIKDLVAL